MSNNEFGFSKFSDNDFYSNVNKELIHSLDIKSDLKIVDLAKEHKQKLQDLTY